MSYVNSTYHIIFATHNRCKALIGEENCQELYRYIWGIIQKNNSTLIRINSMPEHVHILLELDSQTSISQIVRDIKRSSYG